MFRIIALTKTWKSKLCNVSFPTCADKLTSFLSTITALHDAPKNVFTKVWACINQADDSLPVPICIAAWERKRKLQPAIRVLLDNKAQTKG